MVRKLEINGGFNQGVIGLDTCCLELSLFSFILIFAKIITTNIMIIFGGTKKVKASCLKRKDRLKLRQIGFDGTWCRLNSPEKLNAT